MNLKPDSRASRVLARLNQGEARIGDLNKPDVGGSAWHQRVTELRRRGYKIECERVGKGDWRYWLEIRKDRA